MCGIVFFSTCQLAGCKTDEFDTTRLVWGDSLIDTSDRMNAYQLGLETLRDAIDGGIASAEICNPARTAEAHGNVIKLLEQLAADAPNRGFDEDVVEKLHHIQSEWQLLRTRQEERWAKSAEVEALDPRERCLRARDVATTRVEIDRDMSTIFKALIRAR